MTIYNSISKLLPKRAKRIIAKSIGLEIEPNLKLNFPAFVPRGPGWTYETYSKLTLNAINKIFPSLTKLKRSVSDTNFNIKPIKQCAIDEDTINICENLSEKFRNYGSDKSTKHDYHWLYGSLLKNSESVKKILEIGIGYEDVNGSMGSNAKAGGSLRAFRDFCPNAEIYGADINKSVLFKENRISTYPVDQTQSSTLESLGEKIGDEFDLIIDDGLHAALANVNTLSFALSRVKKDGWVVIEDIHKTTLDLWEIVFYLLPKDKFKTDLYEDKNGSSLFTIQRKV